MLLEEILKLIGDDLFVRLGEDDLVILRVEKIIDLYRAAVIEVMDDYDYSETSREQRELRRVLRRKLLEKIGS